jgi:protease I
MKKAVIIVAQGVEDSEFSYPYYRLQEHGFAVDVAIKDKANITGKHGLPIAATVDALTIKEEDYELVVVPGGYESPDRVRQIGNVLRLLKQFDEKGKVIASICHGPWVLISAGIVRSRRMTCYAGCKDDLINAGAVYVEAPVVVDGNIVTSPHFRDNAEWMKQTLATYDRISAGK